MKKKRVLMLGWEFPPIISGGLGIACQGIFESLKLKSDITLVVPYSVSNKDNAIGLNNLKIGELKGEVLRVEEIFEESILKVDVELSPYSITQEYVSNKTLTIREVYELLDVLYEEDITPFASSQIYNDDLATRVVAYSRTLLKLAKTIDFDVIYAHDWMTFLAAVALKKTTCKPLVVHYHSLQYDRLGDIDKGWVFELEKNAALVSNAIITVSEYTKNNIIEKYHASSAKISVVHNGIDHCDVNRITKPFSGKLVTFMGRITSQKGPESFLEIAKEVLKFYKNVRFVMAGDGDGLKNIIESGAYAEIGDRFHFTGFLDRGKVEYLLSMTDVFCMPSVSEPFGIAAIEATKFGVPTIISKQSGVSEILNSAIQVDHWDTKRMVDEIVEILYNQALAETMVEQGFEIIQELTWDNATDKIMNVFDTCLSK